MELIKDSYGKEKLNERDLPMLINTVINGRINKVNSKFGQKMYEYCELGILHSYENGEKSDKREHMNIEKQIQN